MAELMPCPFCGHAPDMSDLADVLYPSGTWWADRQFYGKVYRTYRSHQLREEGDQQCWGMHCTENHGGCGAQVYGHSEQEARDKWNRRAKQEAGG